MPAITVRILCVPFAKNTKIKIIYNCNFACCFIRCETWSLTLRDEYVLRFFENRMLSNNFRPKRNQAKVTWITYIVKNFMICTPHQKYSSDQIKKDVVSGSCDRSVGKGK